jgi:arylsulfatase A-like enzyme
METPNWRIPEKYHYNAWIADSSNHKLTEYAEKGDNFFLWASFLDPHTPRILPSPWDTMYKPEDVEEVPEQNIKEHEKNPPHFRYAQVDGSSKGRLDRIKNHIKIIRNGKKLLEYQHDFRKHGLPVHGLHGMHPHHYNKERLRKEIAAYYGMVSLIDKYIGIILNKLEELGLAENTIVIFTTDHGDFFGQHGLVTKGPYHYEDLLKIPFIVRYPNIIPANRVSDALLSLVDLPPTLHSLVNLPIPSFYTGVDQSKVWRVQQDSARDHILCEMHHSPEIVHLKTYVNERYKITIYNQQRYGELFDLKEDPGEHNNLWDDPNCSELKNDLLFRFIQAELKKDRDYCHPK